MSAVLEAVETPRRYFHLRDVEWADSGSGKEYTFEGSAAVFNVWSEEIWTPRGAFRERVLPGAFVDLLATAPDVRLLQNHDKNRVMARTKSGTLDLEETADALRVWARVAKTSYATDLRLSMERGDVDQMSLAFLCDAYAGGQERWYENKRSGEVLHDVVKASFLRDVSVVTFPAYIETEAAMRELQRGLESGTVSVAFPGLPEPGAAPEPARALDGPPEGYGEPGEPQERARAYRRCAEVVGHTVWAILPGHLSLILAILGERMSGNKPSQEEIRERIGAQRSNEPTSSGGVAIVPLIGPVYSRAGAMQQVSASKSLDIFREQFRQALNDPEVDSVLLDIDSPGGSASGVPEVAEEIYAARGTKPIVAVANTMAASAAYFLGSAAERFYASPSAEVGSVGVYAAHQDLSGAMEQKGIKTTLIHAGRYKVEGNPFEPLSDSAEAQIQADVDAIHDVFVAAVAKHRDTTEEDVRENYGEGRTVFATPATQLGMIDGVATIDQVQAMLRSGSLNIREALGASPAQTAALPPHSTETVDEPWDGPAQTKKVQANRKPLRQLHAWVDSGANPDQKSSYKFPHHVVADNGYPGAANVNGVRAGLSRLPGASIPAADKPGVERHLRRHLDDFHRIHNVPGNASAFSEDPVALREHLGIVARAEIDPAGKGLVAPEAGEPDSVFALRQRTSAAMQRERDDRIRLMKETLR